MYKNEKLFAQHKFINCKQRNKQTNKKTNKQKNKQKIGFKSV